MFYCCCCCHYMSNVGQMQLGKERKEKHIPWAKENQMATPGFKGQETITLLLGWVPQITQCQGSREVWFVPKEGQWICWIKILYTSGCVLCLWCIIFYTAQQITTNLATWNNTHFTLIVSVSQKSGYSLSRLSFSGVHKVDIKMWTRASVSSEPWVLSKLTCLLVEFSSL